MDVIKRSLQQRSRSIQNMDMKRPMVTDLALYPWSSYPAYINLAKAETWLYRDKTYELLGLKQKYAGYKAYVALGTDAETLSYYDKGNARSIIGDKEFKAALAKKKHKLKVNTELAQILSERPSVEDIINTVANVYQVKTSDIKE